VNARLYYQIRIAMFLVMLLAAPLFMLRGPAVGQKGVIAVVLFDVFIAALLAHAVWRFRRVAPGATVGYGPPPEVVREHALTGSRRMPLFALGTGAVILVASWFYLVYEHKGHPIAIVLAPVLFLLGFAGTIHPPIFYAMRNDIGDQPGGARAIAYFLTAVGLGAGLFCAWWVFWR
jgi:hypothetical protein